jgi:hypothetical protein
MDGSPEIIDHASACCPTGSCRMKEIMQVRAS